MSFLYFAPFTGSRASRIKPKHCGTADETSHQHLPSDVLQTQWASSVHAHIRDSLFFPGLASAYVSRLDPGGVSSESFSLGSHRTCSCLHHTTMIYFCVLELEVPQEQWPRFTNCSILALSTVPVFQYYIWVIKILDQHSSRSPPCLGLPRI